MEKVSVTDLISVVSGNVKMPKTAIKKVVDEFVSAIKNELEEGNDVYIKGLVNFKQKVWKEREAYNPAQGRTFIVPERHVIRASVSRKVQAK